jgi:hypothetical protein
MPDKLGAGGDDIPNLSADTSPAPVTPRFFWVEWMRHPRSLHVWFGPLGFHFFGKPIVEWYSGWRG